MAATPIRYNDYAPAVELTGKHRDYALLVVAIVNNNLLRGTNGARVHLTYEDKKTLVLVKLQDTDDFASAWNVCAAVAQDMNNRG